MLANPQAVVEKEIGEIKPGAHLQGQLTVKVIQQNPQELIIILPPNDSVLSDEELSKVAGDSQDIVMTGGGPGRSSTPFIFTLVEPMR